MLREGSGEFGGSANDDSKGNERTYGAGGIFLKNGLREQLGNCPPLRVKHTPREKHAKIMPHVSLF